ncbi:hypothetical protein NQ315_013913, partial [Exocentrus adspersus]
MCKGIDLTPDLRARQLLFRAVRSPRIKSILVVECADALKLARQREAELVWVQGYMEILANERVDQLACFEAKELCEEPEPILGITRGRQLGHLRIKSILVVECADALKLARQREAELVWVPGCMEIPANERVDQLARFEPKELFQGPEPVLGITRE